MFHLLPDFSDPLSGLLLLAAVWSFALIIGFVAAAGSWRPTLVRRRLRDRTETLDIPGGDATCEPR